jgi:hypothetical protein
VLPLSAPLGDSRGWDGCAGRGTAPTINDYDPIRHLGVHAAVLPIAGQADLPALTVYVERPHDEYLRMALRTGRRDLMLLVVGGSSTGKTRACYEALRAVRPNSPVLRPANDDELVALLEADLEPGAVVWLDEAQRFINGQHGGDVARALHVMLDGAPQSEPRRVVIGSIWPPELWLSADDDDKQAVRDLLARPGVTVPICEAFPFPERVERAAEQDPRWRDALAASGGVNLVQFLAGGPSLVRDLENGRYGPDAGALLAAAMDAHRIGFWSPLPIAMLAEAASGYRRPRQGQVKVDLAVADALKPVCGVRALTRAEGHGHAAVILHSYLAQHAREARRREAIPDSLWAAVTSVVADSGDSERVFDSTLHRGLLRWRLTLLRRRADAGDDTAAQQLDWLLHLRGDPEAVAELRARACSGCSRAADLLAERGDPVAVELLRARADAGDRVAAGRLVELYFQRGDPEAEAWLRDRADDGDVAAARRLAELLFHNGGRKPSASFGSAPTGASHTPQPC